MAFALCAFKLVAFSDQRIVQDHCFSTKDKAGKAPIFNESELAVLKRFCSYSLIFYVPHFLTSSFGTDAPVLDLRLYKDLTEYQAVDESLSVEALPTLERHFWYVTPGIVLFRLFSEKLSEDTKSKIASKLLTFPRVSDIKFGLPDCPSLTVNTEFCLSVCQLPLDLITIIR